MSREWFKLSFENGCLEPAKRPIKSKPIRWIERDLENLLALNPAFLGVEDHVPLRLGGVRGTVSSPDQAFVDELGRVVVVEVKKIQAPLAVISQAMAYADHWRLLPPGEIDHSLLDLADANRRELKFGDALKEVLCWADADPSPGASEKNLTRLGKMVLKRLSPAWAQAPVASITALARQRWQCEQLPFIGAPARVIAIAPGFSDECVAFAEQLADRRVGIELVEVEILRSGEQIYVGREWVHRDSLAEPTWRFFRRAWELPPIRDHFLLNGWADALNMEAFSLSAREATDAKLWFCASDRRVYIWTAVPSGWHRDSQRLRRELREEFITALPEDPDRSGGWLNWEFSLPKDEAKVIPQILEVGRAIQKVLVASEI